MNYKLPLAVVLLCYHAVIGSEVVDENGLSQSSDDEALHRVRRGGLSMLRLGRGLQMLRLGKRALPMLRLGRSTEDNLSEDDFEYILSLMRNGRQIPMPRYGKDLTLQYMIMSALKNNDISGLYDDMAPGYGYGYDLDNNPERQIRPVPRPGRYRRSADVDEDEEVSDNTLDLGVRVAPFPRFGKELTKEQEEEARMDSLKPRVVPLMRYGKQEDEEDIDQAAAKRAMRMLRLGRGMRMLRLGKRPMESDELSEMDKRALRLLRLGKRPFQMLRLGRSQNEEQKRALRLLRLGKKSTSESS